MARTTFSGPVRSLNGFLTTGNNMAQSLSAGTIDAEATTNLSSVASIDKYQGKIMQVTDAAIIFNLPEIVVDTGSDEQIKSPNTTSTIGYEYGFLFTESLTSSNTFILNAGTAAGRSTADVFNGMAWYSNSATDPAANASWGSNGYDTLTLDATTRGGLIGTYVTVRAVAANVWVIQVMMNGNGTMVTPWS
jgi:hypothetical protein